MWTKQFWQDALERAIRTLAQTFVALITAAGTGLLDSDWVGIASACGMAFVVALVSAIAFPPKSTEAVSARSNY